MELYLPENVLCPLCGSGLERRGGSLFCESGHCFDIAKEQYVNLLPPGSARNARTGDSAEMIHAREVFLGSGAYDLYPAEAASVAAAFLRGAARERGTLTVLDAGCGEGRHTVNIASTLSKTLGVPVTALGFDASKKGAAAAAKRYVLHDGKMGEGDVNPFFAAGNIFSLPVRDASVDVFCSLFAPLPEKEALRTVRPGGLLIICAAGGEHLHELREVLYETPVPSGGGAAVPEGFTACGNAKVEYPVKLDGREMIDSLFGMTPFCHNAPAEGREKLKTLDELTVTVQVACTFAIRNKESL